MTSSDDVLADVVDRAKSYVDEGNDVDEAIDYAIDDGLIYYDDQLAVIRDYGGSDVISEALLQCLDDFRNAVAEEVERYADEQQEDM